MGENDAFAIDGDTLVTAKVLDFEASDTQIVWGEK